jgi:hypothetical protein
VRAFKPKIDRFLSCRKLKNINSSGRQHPAVETELSENKGPFKTTLAKLDNNETT